MMSSLQLVQSINKNSVWHRSIFWSQYSNVFITTRISSFNFILFLGIFSFQPSAYPHKQGIVFKIIKICVTLQTRNGITIRCSVLSNAIKRTYVFIEPSQNRYGI
jgi:hypothetical protein